MALEDAWFAVIHFFTSLTLECLLDMVITGLWLTPLSWEVLVDALGFFTLKIIGCVNTISFVSAYSVYTVFAWFLVGCQVVQSNECWLWVNPDNIIAVFLVLRRESHLPSLNSMPYVAFLDVLYQLGDVFFRTRFLRAFYKIPCMHVRVCLMLFSYEPIFFCRHSIFNYWFLN